MIYVLFSNNSNGDLEKFRVTFTKIELKIAGQKNVYGEVKKMNTEADHQFLTDRRFTTCDRHVEA